MVWSANSHDQIWTMAGGEDLFTALYGQDGTYQAAKHLAQMYSALEPPDPELIRRKSQKGWKWSPPIENDHGDLCEDARLYFNGPFFDGDSGMY